MTLLRVIVDTTHWKLSKVFKYPLWVQNQVPAVSHFPSEQLAQVQEEISSLREKGAISVVADPSLTHREEKFFLTLFLVPKKNESMRPVINLKALNKWVETRGVPIRYFDLLPIGYFDLLPIADDFGLKSTDKPIIEPIYYDYYCPVHTYITITDTL